LAIDNPPLLISPTHGGMLGNYRIKAAFLNEFQVNLAIISPADLGGISTAILEQGLSSLARP